MSLNRRGIKQAYRLARGTVRIRLQGVCTEKVINSMTASELELWDITSEGELSLLFTIHAADLTEVCGLAQKCSCETEIISARGGKAITIAAKRRIALIIGLFACVSVISASSLFVWNISVTGNSTVSNAELIRTLNESGVSYGCFWPSIDAAQVKNEILLRCPELSWLSINMGNSELELAVHERREKPRIVSEAEPRSIYAAKDGIIANISVLQGKASVAEGDTVCKGDLLVSGIIDSETGDERQVHALAEVMAHTWYEITAVTPIVEMKKTEAVGMNLKIAVLFGKNRIKFYTDSRNSDTSCDKINKIGMVCVDGLFVLPVGISVQRAESYLTAETEVFKQESVLRLQDTLLAELRHRIGNGEIVSQSFSTAEHDGLLAVTLRAECLENIADGRE